MGPESGPIPLAKISYESPPVPRKTSLARTPPSPYSANLLGLPSGKFINIYNRANDGTNRARFSH